MNIVEKLLATDKGEFEKIGNARIISKQLSLIFGEGTEITIKAISGDEYNALSMSALDHKGRMDYGQLYDINAKIAAAGLTNPNLKDKDLLSHLGVATPADAAKKLFKGEVNKIAAEVARLSGFENEESTDSEVKN